MCGELTYKRSGVDIDEGERFVRLISPLAKRTFRKEVLTEIGLFSGMFRLDLTRYKEPVLVSGTDGVGTKLKIAFMMDKHDTVGIDLVAMCVNDILTAGAEPLFFLDYLATSKLNADKASSIIEGIVRGCEEAGCSLIGGETAEMPGFYQEGEYDISGFSVGVVEREKIIDGSKIKEGDVIIGIASNGLHSNGYSLVRKLFFDIKKMKLETYIPELGVTLGEELLKPTRIYTKAFMTLKDKVEIKGMAHITGGGIPLNLLRILPEGSCANIKKGSWQVPGIFRLIEETGSASGGISEEEMRRTFNMGIGYIIVISEKESEGSISLLNNTGYKTYIIGNIESVSDKENKSVIFT
ncbi:MAG: phosphoribosylformylglycinamidine cyclo-ligase [Nitrospirae bacterium]|nr:phosphoribosylformylglycinamidine cyclo-ligase [Nitrospirota bacterium]